MFKIKYINRSIRITRLYINMNREFPIRSYNGKGIITASSKKFMFQTLVSLNMLRDQGCDLPIELFYADDEELDEADKVCLELTLNVTCINIQTIQEFKDYNARNFSIKAIALYLSSFDETLWMDADIIPLMNFEDLFKHEHYTTHHHIFFNDIFAYDRYENAKTKSTRELYKTFDVSIQSGTPETDSGLYVIHKSKFPIEFVPTNMSLNTNPNTYQHVYGDKELYRLSMELTKSTIKYTTVDQNPCFIGKYFEKENIFCGNAVLLKMNDLQVCVHMTLHSIDHINKYNGIWKDSFWTHYTTRNVECILQVVEPINQEILIKHEYDRKFMAPLNQLLQTTQTQMYKYIHQFINNYL